MSKLPRWFKVGLYLTADFFAILSVGFLILLSRDLSSAIRGSFILTLTIYALLLIFILNLFKVYAMITIYFGLIDSFKIGLTTILFNLLFLVYVLFSDIPFSILEAVFVLISVPTLLIGLRVARRTLAIFLGYQQSNRKNLTRTLIVGAGAAAKIVIYELRSNRSLNSTPVVVMDDDPQKWKRKFLNLQVEGPLTALPKVIEKYHVSQVIIGIGNITRTRLFEILRIMEKSNVKIRRLPLMEELEKDGQQMKVKDVDVNDLLGRDVIPLINDEIQTFIKDQVVLITGAGGSIGSELTRQIFTYQPKVIVLFDIYENGVYDVQQELLRLNQKLQKQIPIHVQIGATYNLERLEQIFKTYKPSLVFHAAAYKHVPLMQDSPQEAVRTNVLGTYNVAKLSQSHQVKKMVLVSTDKAVRSTNVMGATKYYAETIMRHFAKQKSGTSYAAVRFGNVLASNGSVIPLFKKQIELGGPVTVTDKNITRFFMTIPEAVGLILQSGVYAQDGEIFVLDMGKPVKILDLAEKMIRQSGYIPYEEIKIEFTGLRPGEKMYEELLLDPKTTTKTNSEKIFIDRTELIGFNEEGYQRLLRLALNNDVSVIKELFQQLNLKG
ncbi:MAG: polysaccharide biosynthesis protein [Firmicutes bacterium]|nr:polysaccharide biosynthesis protein [Bacillota bacterium]